MDATVTPMAQGEHPVPTRTLLAMEKLRRLGSSRFTYGRFSDINCGTCGEHSCGSDVRGSGGLLDVSHRSGAVLPVGRDRGVEQLEQDVQGVGELEVCGCAVADDEPVLGWSVGVVGG